MVSQNTLETRMSITIKIHQSFALRPSRYSDKIVTVNQNVLTVSKEKPSKKTWLTGKNLGTCLKNVP